MQNDGWITQATDWISRNSIKLGNAIDDVVAGLEDFKDSTIGPLNELDNPDTNGTYSGTPAGAGNTLGGGIDLRAALIFGAGVWGLVNLLRR